MIPDTPVGVVWEGRRGVAAIFLSSLHMPQFIRTHADSSCDTVIAGVDSEKFRSVEEGTIG